MENLEETAQQKAVRLGVPLFLTPPKVEKIPTFIDADKNDYLKDYYSRIIGVCETCGKDIKISTRQEPCGKQQCPFGELSM